MFSVRAMLRLLLRALLIVIATREAASNVPTTHLSLERVMQKLFNSCICITIAGLAETDPQTALDLAWRGLYTGT